MMSMGLHFKMLPRSAQKSCTAPSVKPGELLLTINLSQMTSMCSGQSTFRISMQAEAARVCRGALAQQHQRLSELDEQCGCRQAELSAVQEAIRTYDLRAAEAEERCAQLAADEADCTDRLAALRLEEAATRAELSVQQADLSHCEHTQMAALVRPALSCLDSALHPSQARERNFDIAMVTLHLSRNLGHCFPRLVLTIHGTLQAALKETECQVDAATASSKGVADQLSTTQSKLQAAQQHLAEVGAEVDRAEHRREQLARVLASDKAESAHLQIEFSNLKEQLDTLKHAVAEQQCLIKERASQREACDSAIAGLESDIKTRHARADAAAERLEGEPSSLQSGLCCIVLMWRFS
jgi:chromosome segregation ATPase